MGEHLRQGHAPVDASEVAKDERHAVLRITAKSSSKRIVLRNYHLGRDRIIAELERRGVRHFSEAIRQPV